MTEISPLKYLDVLHNIGLDDVKKMQKKFGGPTFYVRKTRSHESFKELVNAIGEEKAEMLRHKLGGTTFPYPPDVFKGSRQKRSAENYEIRRMHKFGIDAVELSLWYRRDKDNIERVLNPYPTQRTPEQRRLKKEEPKQVEEEIVPKKVNNDTGFTREDLIEYVGLDTVVEAENDLLKEIEECGVGEIGIDVEFEQNGEKKRILIFGKYKDTVIGDGFGVVGNDDLYFEYEIS